MAFLAQLQRLFLPNATRFEVQHMYIALVEHARNPVFYTELSVPDTLDGRFDMITLHMHLVLDRLKAGYETHGDWVEKGRILVEAYLADMARSLREMGVGDTGVAKRIQKMASAFYGRMDAYGKAKGNDAELEGALRRNVYGTLETVEDAKVKRLAAFVRAAEAMLAALPDDAVKAENLGFPAP